jgi:hypothetical protein
MEGYNERQRRLLRGRGRQTGNTTTDDQKGNNGVGVRKGKGADLGGGRQTGNTTTKRLRWGGCNSKHWTADDDGRWLMADGCRGMVTWHNRGREEVGCCCCCGSDFSAIVLLLLIVVLSIVAPLAVLLPTGFHPVWISVRHFYVGLVLTIEQYQFSTVLPCWSGFFLHKTPFYHFFATSNDILQKKVDRPLFSQRVSACRKLLVASIPQTATIVI